MHVSEALRTRRSIRQFKSRAIEPSVLNRVLENALQSPSSGNVQPYRLAIAQGDQCNQLKTTLSQKFAKAMQVKRLPLPLKLWHGLTGGVLPDGDYNPDVTYPSELKQRKFECGMGLYETLGIERQDYQARDRQMQRNFEFFDAPVAIFIFVHDKLGIYSALDAGIFMQSLMLAAVEEGLGTCPQAALATWSSPIKQHFKIEEGYKLICGMSLGYPEEHVVNQYRPIKRAIEEICLPAAPPGQNTLGAELASGR